MLCLPQGLMGDRAKAMNKGSVSPADEENPDKNHPRQLRERKAGRRALESEQTITARERREGEGIGSEHDRGYSTRTPGGSPHCNPTAMAATSKPTTTPRSEPSFQQWPWGPPPAVLHRGIPYVTHPAERKRRSSPRPRRGNHRYTQTFNHWKLFSDPIWLHIMNDLTLDICSFPLKHTFLEDKAPIWAWIQWNVHKNTFPREKYSYTTSLLSTGLTLCLVPHRASSTVTCVHACKVVSVVWTFVTLRTVDHQALLFMGFSRQEYWNGLPCPPPGDFPDPGIEPLSPASAYIGRRVLYH